MSPSRIYLDAERVLSGKYQMNLLLNQLADNVALQSHPLFLQEMSDLPPEFQDVLSENYWDLLLESSDGTEKPTTPTSGST